MRTPTKENYIPSEREQSANERVAPVSRSLERKAMTKTEQARVTAWRLALENLLGLADLSRGGVRGIAVSFINYLAEVPFFRDEVLPRLVRMGVRAKN